MNNFYAFLLLTTDGLTKGTGFQVYSYIEEYNL